jgi:citrate synthase
MNQYIDDPSWVGAAEASQLLRVSRPTLYAYVSRGYIRSESKPGSSRQRRYSRDDVERLRRRTEARRNPDKAAAHALRWGVPILESSITLIAGNALYYRGHDAVELSRSRSIEEVASLIWLGRLEATFSETTIPTRTGGGEAARLPFVAHAQSLLAAAAATDSLAFDLRPGGVALTGWRILNLLSSIPTRSRMSSRPIEEKLARAWGVHARGADLLRAALILCADHELNVSSFTARTVASAGSSPYGVVIAGLAALEGSRHGGASIRVEAMLDSLRHERQIHKALGERLRRGETIEGFGHPLYRDGDPRALALLAWLRARYARSPEVAFIDEVVRRADSVVREKPNIDFALAALARALQLPPGSPLTLFALGRTIGWIGHAIEQYSTGQLIRPRAKYVGVPPVPA